jgi:hypothetical protein
MSGIVKNHILWNEVYEPGSEIWAMVIERFRIPTPFINPPLVYTFLYGVPHYQDQKLA